MRRPVDNAHNPVIANEKAILMFVRNTWKDHHPWHIADYLNTKYRLHGCFELHDRNIWNYRQMIRRLDREAEEG